jgi:hypothetical protein
MLSFYTCSLTGWGTETEVRKTRESGFDYQMVKPVDANALLELLSQIEPRGLKAAPPQG